MSQLIKSAKTFLNIDESGKKRIIDYYNKHCINMVRYDRRYKMKYTDEWCAAFTSVIAHLCGLQRFEFPYEVSVLEQYKIGRETHKWCGGTDGVEVGDLLVFDWLGNGTFDHVGFVSNVTETHIETLEGNYSDTVKYRTTPRYSRIIRGFIAIARPLQRSESDRLLTLAKGVLKGVYGDGEQRKERLGGDYDAVQGIVNRLLAG